jgi:histidinol dehydrogenase
MKTYRWADLDAASREAVLARPQGQLESDKEQTVARMIEIIQAEGQAAISRFAAQFDGYAPSPYLVPQDMFAAAEAALDDDLKHAIKQAHANISAFHEQQGYVAYTCETTPGIFCSREVRPFASVGLYIPGGSAPLFSTVLMLAIPARIAGCQTIILATPADKNGQIHPAILFAAKLCGVTQILRLGGVQAIGALAFGSGETPPVQKILGPGNIWVTLAKQTVASLPNGPLIDIPAGPSEVMVVADSTCPPAYVAADLLAQAEHDILSQVVLLAPNANYIAEVMQQIDTQLAELPRADIARQAIASSVALDVADRADQIAIINAYGPEHLILACDDADAMVDDVTAAGSIFVGIDTPESLGDYASGTNHVLPTMGWAKKTGGVSVEAFQRTFTVQKASRDGLIKLGPTVVSMARAEGLDAHAAAITIRTGQNS